MPSVTAEDRERLVGFIKETYQLISSVIAEGVDGRRQRVVPEEVLLSLQDAWREFREQYPAEQAEAAIRRVGEDRLVWAGLYGAQLTVKLSTIARFRARFSSFGGGRWLKKLLNAIDRLLDSLIAATGMDEALKELKDVLSDNIEEET